MVLLAILLLILAIGAAVLIAGVIYQAWGTAADSRRYPPPGRLIDIGESRLHLIESGTGPTVILESGISATCLNWTRVRGEVAGFARASTYDRAWLGWSDPANSPRTTLTLVDELHRLLGGARISPPYILAGHSFGGMLVRAYAGKISGRGRGLGFGGPAFAHRMAEYFGGARSDAAVRGEAFAARGDAGADRCGAALVGAIDDGRTASPKADREAE